MLDWLESIFYEVICMEWWEIVFQLLDDPMIKSCGCDGLLDANNSLRGLLGMCELIKISDDFILEVINASIDARNRYCSLNGAEKLHHVAIIDGEFEFE